MRRSILFALLCVVKYAGAQELFVFTEPASNMATSTFGIRMNNSFIQRSANLPAAYQLAPELMFGISKRLMLHGEMFFNNSDRQGFSLAGGSMYAKYRFYSQDEVHSHFRMAAFAKYGLNKRIIRQEAVDIGGLNSGYETGLVFTKLINKTALSGSLSFLHATNNGNNNSFIFGNSHRDAMGYSLSAGKLLLPREYTSYRQTNLNAMVEILGQMNTGSHYSYLDLAPSLQLIINSVARVDIGQRLPLVKRLARSAPGQTFVRFEYNFFNLLK